MNIARYNRWCKENETERFWDSVEDTAYAAWKAATLAERERCVEEVLYRLRGDQANLDYSCGDVNQYYSGKVDAFDEVLDAIRNP